jgi:class 3 adenylate cyclase
MLEASESEGQSLPSGTITFLFTDIEGSTRLWQEDPASMKEALAGHHARLQHAIEQQGGYVFQIVGDAFHEKPGSPWKWPRKCAINTPTAPGWSS